MNQYRDIRYDTIYRAIARYVAPFQRGWHEGDGNQFEAKFSTSPFALHFLPSLAVRLPKTYKNTLK